MLTLIRCQTKIKNKQEKEWKEERAAKESAEIKYIEKKWNEFEAEAARRAEDEALDFLGTKEGRAFLKIKTKEIQKETGMWSMIPLTSMQI